MNGVISFAQLSEAMRLGDLGEQIVLKSRKAYEHIEFTGSEEVDHLVWYPKRAERDKSARKVYHSAAELTQKALAERSGVSVRMIEQYEQGKKDINKASARTVYQLSRTLHCRMEDLIGC